MTELDIDKVKDYMDKQPTIDEMAADFADESKCSNCGREIKDPRQAHKIMGGLVVICNHRKGAFNRMTGV
jgi:hypothetical protein